MFVLSKDSVQCAELCASQVVTPVTTACVHQDGYSMVYCCAQLFPSQVDNVFIWGGSYHLNW
jgi:hypothetical protein